MTLGYVDPDGDITANWPFVVPGPNHYAAIDDLVRQPNVPDLDNYIGDDIGSFNTDSFDMTYPSTSGTIVSVSNVTVWIYCVDTEGSGQNIDISINMTGSWETDKTVPVPTSAAWESASFDGTWTGAQLYNLQVRLNSLTGGAQIRCYAMYAEITYQAEGGVSFFDVKLNIGDTWKSASLSGMKINIGGIWKTIDQMWINIGGVWKEIFETL